MGHLSNRSFPQTAGACRLGFSRAGPGRVGVAQESQRGLGVGAELETPPGGYGQSVSRAHRNRLC